MTVSDVRDRRPVNGTAREDRPWQPLPTTDEEALASVGNAEPVALPTRRGMVRGLASVLLQPRSVGRERTPASHSGFSGISCSMAN